MFAPGTRVIDADCSRSGVVVENPKAARPLGFVPIRWDSGGRTIVHPSNLEEQKSGPVIPAKKSHRAACKATK
jgi:hypothetical protein